MVNVCEKVLAEDQKKTDFRLPRMEPPQCKRNRPREDYVRSDDEPTEACQRLVQFLDRQVDNLVDKLGVGANSEGVLTELGMRLHT